MMVACCILLRLQEYFSHVANSQLVECQYTVLTRYIYYSPMALSPHQGMWDNKKSQSHPGALGHHHSGRQMILPDGTIGPESHLKHRTRDPEHERTWCPAMVLVVAGYSVCVVRTPLCCGRVLCHLGDCECLQGTNHDSKHTWL